jgi:hypothetical protein
MNTTKGLNQNSQCPGLDSSPAPPRYKYRVVPLCRHAQSVVDVAYMADTRSKCSVLVWKPLVKGE